MILIDTDVGVDDALAIALAERWVSRSRAVKYVTTFGNVSERQAACSLDRLLRKLRASDFSFFRGAERALDGFTSGAERIHGVDGLGGQLGSAPSDFVAGTPLSEVAAMLREMPPKSVELLCIGPATSTATILQMGLSERFSRIVLMGGVLLDRGNITPRAEFNVYSDPTAFNAVIASGVRVDLVPLDLCRKILLSRARLGSFELLGAVGTILRLAHAHYMDRYFEFEHIDGCFPHDTIALVALLRPDWFLATPARVFAAEGNGDERGRITFSLHDAPNCNVFFGGQLAEVRRTLESWDIQ